MLSAGPSFFNWFKYWRSSRMAGPVQEGSDSRVDLHTRENKESNLNSTICFNTQQGFPSGNLSEIFSISTMEKVLENPKFHLVFRIFPERCFAKPEIFRNKFRKLENFQNAFWKPENISKTVLCTSSSPLHFSVLCRSCTHIIYNTKEIK